MRERERTPVIEFQDFSFQYFSQAEPTLHKINLRIYEGGKGVDCWSERKRKKYTWELLEWFDSICI